MFTVEYRWQGIGSSMLIKVWPNLDFFSALEIAKVAAKNMKDGDSVEIVPGGIEYANVKTIN